tara:strand:+ start:1646 stop:2377 length:732 start_codon:yes stop_codon:yes gene_type:complete
MKKFLYFFLFLVICIYITSEFIGDKIIKGTLEDNITNTLDRKTKIENLKINYFKGEALITKLKLENKDFPDHLLTIDKAYFELKTSSIFSSIIDISAVELDGIEFNYYFNFKKAKVKDNVNSLNKSIDNNESSSSHSKKFNIEELNIKNIVLSVNSPDLKISQEIPLKDIQYKNVGNTEKSKNYKTIIKDFSKNIEETVKNKILKKNFKDKLNKLRDVGEDKIKDELEKNKDKLKNKLKKIIK